MNEFNFLKSPIVINMEIARRMQKKRKANKLTKSFNVFSHNRDDHSKNFSFLYDHLSGKWSLSPAYDLTYSNSIGGEHATTVNGNGQNPGIKDIMAVADHIKLNHSKAYDIANSIQNTVENNLHDLIEK